MTVQAISDPPTHWTKDYRRWTRTIARVTADLGAIRNHAVAVGIPADAHPFAQVQALLDRAEQWKRAAREGGAAVGQEVEAARVRALASPDVTVEVLNTYIGVIERARPWWDEVPMNVEAALPGRKAAAALAADKLYEAERWKAGQVLNEATGPLYKMFARQAAAAVAQVAAVLPLPAQVWSAPKPVNVLAAAARETLQEAERVFNACHYMALWLRSMGVADTDDQLLGDEPIEGLTFCRWADFNEHRHELGPLHDPLKLAYAVEHGWEPGLWLASELRGVDQGPARRRFSPSVLLRRG